MSPIGKKAAIRELMAPLIAARAAAISFEQLAEMLGASGLELSSKTLRSYFFECKRDDELATDARKHAERVERVGREVQSALRAKRQAHAERVARAAAAGEESASQLEEAPAAPTSPAAAVGHAYSIDELETRSQATEERTVLAEDLEVRDGKVFLASGQAFDGYLTKKQLMFLRHMGRLIAPTKRRLDRGS